MISKTLERLRDIKKDFSSDINAKEKLAKRLRNNYKVSNDLPDLKFKTCQVKDNFLKYADSLKVQDLAGPSLKGLTILKVIACKDVEFIEHSHINQSQTIYVLKGKIVNLIDNIIFSEGKSFFTSKNNKHKIKYMKDSEVIIVYLPNLEIL